MSPELRDALTVLAALTTPLIAVIALYIAYQQHKTSQRKLFLELYERRLGIYQEVRKLLSAVFRDADVPFIEVLQFGGNVYEAEFLFGPEIIAYLKELASSAHRLSSWNDQYRDHTQEKPPGYDHQKVVDGRHTELEWLTLQPEIAREKFRKYLSITVAW